MESLQENCNNMEEVAEIVEGSYDAETQTE